MGGRLQLEVPEECFRCPNSRTSSTPMGEAFYIIIDSNHSTSKGEREYKRNDQEKDGLNEAKTVYGKRELPLCPRVRLAVMDSFPCPVDYYTE